MTTDDLDWATARPTCRVTPPRPKDWEDTFLDGRAVRRLSCPITLFQLDAGYQILPTDARFTAHHRVVFDGYRWWCDGVEVIEEPDAPSLPMPRDPVAVDECVHGGIP